MMNTPLNINRIWSSIGYVAIICTIFLVGTGFRIYRPNPPVISYVRWSSPNFDEGNNKEIKDEIYHHTTFLNTGDKPATKMEIIEIIADKTEFKLNSVKVNVEFTELSVVIEYSSDFDLAHPFQANWTYQPVNQKGGNIGFDRNVKAIRLRVVDGMLSNLPPNNKGSIGLVTKNY